MVDKRSLREGVTFHLTYQFCRTTVEESSPPLDRTGQLRPKKGAPGPGKGCRSLGYFDSDSLEERESGNWRTRSAKARNGPLFTRSKPVGVVIPTSP